MTDDDAGWKELGHFSFVLFHANEASKSHTVGTYCNSTYLQSCHQKPNWVIEKTKYDISHSQYSTKSRGDCKKTKYVLVYKPSYTLVFKKLLLIDGEPYCTTITVARTAW